MPSPNFGSLAGSIRWSSERVYDGLRQTYGDHLPNGRCCGWLIVEDVDFRYILAAKVVDKEMSCQDDHWNDGMDTRPDVAWQGRFHEANDLVEFCGRPYLSDRDAWIRAYVEASEEVMELRRSGHARARGILDLPNEMAYTCDHCRLWGFVGHIDKRDPFSEEERTGALFSATTCDPDAVHKTFGKPFDPNSAWDREDDSPSPSEVVRGQDKRYRNKRKAAEYAFYYKLRKKEEKRATTTS